MSPEAWLGIESEGQLRIEGIVMPYLETLRKAAGLDRVRFEACWALSGTTFGNVGGNQVDSVWPCLEREAKGGNRDLELNSLEVVVDPLRVNMVSEGSYTKKRAEGWEQWGKQLYFKEEKRKRDSRNEVRRGGIQEGKSKTGREHFRVDTGCQKVEGEGHAGCDRNLPLLSLLWEEYSMHPTVCHRHDPLPHCHLSWNPAPTHV